MTEDRVARWLEDLARTGGEAAYLVSKGKAVYRADTMDGALLRDAGARILIKIATVAEKLPDDAHGTDSGPPGEPQRPLLVRRKPNRYTGILPAVIGIKERREQAGLSQAELAARTGIARTNLSAYESGRRTPSPDTLRRITEACRLRPSEVVATHRDLLLDIVRQHFGGRVWLFGSAARGDDRWDSDLDLIVELDREAGLKDIARMQRDLTVQLGVRVDIVDRDALDQRGNERFAAQVLAEAVPV